MLLALAAGAADAQAAKPLDRLDRQLDKLVGLEEGPPGASALVQRRGRVDYLRAGAADLDSGRPMRRNDHLRIASNSKAFSGAVALPLVDDGSLSLDSTIAELLPELPAAWGAVTLRQLLQHTSGIPSYTTTMEWQEFLSMNLGASVTPEFLLGFVADEPLEFTPGSEYAYSNSDNVVIGLMAEAATGRSYEELLGDLVFSPLRLKRTSMPSGLDMPRPYVRGYDIAPPAPPEDISEVISPSELWAAGGMVSTPADLNRFIRAYAGGRLIEPSTRLRQRSFIPGAAGEPPGPGHNSGGLALYRYRTNCGTVLGHTGNFLGYTAFIAATPNGRRSAVVSVNEQLAADAKPDVFKQLRRAFRLAACAALRHGKSPRQKRVESKMRVLRHRLAAIELVDGKAGHLAHAGGSVPLVDVEGRPIKRTEPYPGLLVGARDKHGFDAYASSARRHDLSPSSTGMVGSETKTFTAAAILQLDQEGKLSIEDTLADPRWSDVLDWPDADNITIEMVLSHTAGIPDFTGTTQFQESIGDPDSLPTPEDLLGFVRDLPPSYPPGKRWEYSNTDYIILGLIIEQVTGNTYASELETRFFGPLGLSDTYLYGDPRQDPSMQGFYLWCRGAPQADGAGGPPKCPSGVGEWLPMAAPYTNSWPVIWAAGSVASSTRDLTKWITDLVATDKVLDAEHRRLMQTPTPQSRKGIRKEFPDLAKHFKGYGLGMCYFKYDIGRAYGHAGNIMGFASNSVYLPGRRNRFAMTLIADETHADTAAKGSNKMATVLKRNRR